MVDVVREPLLRDGLLRLVTVVLEPYLDLKNGEMSIFIFVLITIQLTEYLILYHRLELRAW